MVKIEHTHTKWKVATESSSHAKVFLKESSCPENDNINSLVPWRVTNDDTTRSVLVHIPQELCTNLLAWQDAPKDKHPLRILLAIHGYGGQPRQEIKKWLKTAIALQTIIIAPQGTLTESNGRLGWNAIDCCGDPVTNKIDDVGFLHGLLDSVLDTLSLAMNDNAIIEDAHVIATGFSNGGFMSSLLGLQTERHPNLVGIIPTGGYQYNLELYDNNNLQSEALPMMAHHGGKDGVVLPDGCCNSGSSESNCELDIGINEQSCTSVQTAFEKWSQINRCKSTYVDDASRVGGRSERQLVEDVAPHTCWRGNDCLAPTELCIWTNEGHIWGAVFPGVDLAQSWMEKVYIDAETKSNLVPIPESGEGGGENTMYNDTQTSLLIATLFIFCCMVVRFMVLRYRSRFGYVKRKNSEDHGSVQMV
ncbi:hypothetical protein ACHAXN_007456 [Cyclotella atomus]